MFEALFVKVLEMSLSASLVILAVLLLRLCLRRAPRVFSYALWIVVLFRLLCPFSVASPFGLVPDYPLADAAMSGEQKEVKGLSAANQPVGTVPAAAGNLTGMGDTDDSKTVRPEENEGDVRYVENGRRDTGGDGEISRRGESAWYGSALRAGFKTGSVIWAAGILVLAIYSACSFVMLRRKTACSLCLRENIYLADNIVSPFVFGLLRPRIYLPSDLEGEAREYIVMHERHHIRRLDPLVKLLAFLALCVHWFNPLVWLAFVLLEHDMEMSCDEAVMRRADADIRAQYSALILRFATGKHVISGVPLAFGEGDPGSRIRNVMDYKKPRFWVLAVAFTICVTAGVCLLTNMSAEAGEMDAAKELPSASDTELPREENAGTMQAGSGDESWETGISWEERRAFVEECLEHVTAERLRAVTDGLSFSNGEWTVTWEQMQAWERLEDNYFRIGEEAGGDAVLYGLYGGDAMVLRVKDRVYPIRLDWQNMHRVFPRFYGADYDGDGEIEYAIVRLTATGTCCSVETLHIVEVDGENYRLVEFEKEDWISQLGRVTWEYDEESELLQLYADGEPVCTADLHGYFDGEEFTFQGLTWGDINSFEYNGSRLYLDVAAGVNRGTPGSVMYDINLASEVSYQQDGSFRLVGKINCSFLPPIEMPTIKWTSFSYKGVKYELADHLKDIKYIDSCRFAGKHFVLTAVGPNMKDVFVVFNSESCEIEAEIVGWRMAWRGDDVTTAVYVRGRTLYAYDGTEIAELDLSEHEYVDSLLFAEDGSAVRVIVRSPERELVVQLPQ